MAASRERRSLWGSLGISLALHGAGFAALALGVAPGAPGAAGGGGRGGRGVVFVALVADPGGSPGAAAGNPAETRREPAPRVAREAPPLRAAPPRVVPVAVPRAPAPSAVESRTLEPVAARPLPTTAAAPRGARAVGPPAKAPAPASTSIPSGTGATGFPGLAAATAGGSGAVHGSGSGRDAVAAAGAGDCPDVSERVARPASRIAPRYPESARTRGDEASVVVEAWVGASGRVERAQVSGSAGPDFDAAALAAVRDARFHPARRDCAPVPSAVAMRVHFALER